MKNNKSESDIEKIHEEMKKYEHGPCKECTNWNSKITEAQRNNLHESVRECRCLNRGWCSKMNWPTREIDGCSDLTPAEALKIAGY